MYDRMKFVGDLLVLVLVAFPPFLYFYQYISDKVRNIALRVLIFAFYWGGTVIASNLVPASVVLFLIWRSKKENIRYRLYNEDSIINNEYNKRKFNLDCSGAKWKFNLVTFIIISLWGIFIKFIVTYINIIAIELLNKFNIILQNQEIIDDFLKSSLWKGAIYFIIIVVCAPIVEEFVFRFWIYDRLLKSRINTFLAATFSSLLFMSAHFNVQGAVAFFLIGITNCYLYEKRGYWAAVANHFMFNFITVVLLIIIKVFNIPLEA